MNSLISRKFLFGGHGLRNCQTWMIRHARNISGGSVSRPDIEGIGAKLRALAAQRTVPKKPLPVCDDFVRSTPLNTKDLEEIIVGENEPYIVTNFSDRVAYLSIRLLAGIADLFFQKRYLHRAIVLETVAAVPGMVAGAVRHLRSLRLMRHDGGWISHLLAEAENERMHLLTWMKVTNPNWFERFIVMSVQAFYLPLFFLFYVISPKTAHRFVAFGENYSVKSYTAFIKEIDEGRIKNVAAPQMAIDYWNLEPNATLRDVVLAVRIDEANHRDVNHTFSDRIIKKNEDLRKPF